jgi:hypothetical protein
MPEAVEEVLGYELVIDVAGPGVQDRVRIEGRTLGDLEPGYVDHDGYRFERYPGDVEGEFVEVRADYIITRRAGRAGGASC